MKRIVMFVLSLFLVTVTSNTQAVDLTVVVDAFVKRSIDKATALIHDPELRELLQDTDYIPVMQSIDEGMRNDVYRWINLRAAQYMRQVAQQNNEAVVQSNNEL